MITFVTGENGKAFLSYYGISGENNVCPICLQLLSTAVLFLWPGKDQRTRDSNVSVYPRASIFEVTSLP